MYDECLQDCENGQKRTRECLAENGDVVSGICLGSGVNERQTEILVSMKVTLYIFIRVQYRQIFLPYTNICQKENS